MVKVSNVGVCKFVGNKNPFLTMNDNNNERDFFSGLQAAPALKQTIHAERYDNGTWDLQITHRGVADATMKKVATMLPMIFDAVSAMVDQLANEQNQAENN